MSHFTSFILEIFKVFCIKSRETIELHPINEYQDLMSDTRYL